MIQSPTTDALYLKVGAFLQAIVGPGVEIVQGLGNRVPPPPGPYVAVTFITQGRISTNESSYTDDAPTTGTRTVSAGMRVDLQWDFFGPLAVDWGGIACKLWRDDYGCEILAPECQPLYADDGTNMPFVTGEQEYQQRFMVLATLQWNPATVLPQQFADQLAVNIIEVDAEYPP